MSWSLLTKNVASWANMAKNILASFLLKEDNGYLLLETGDKILLEESGLPFSLQTKNIS